MIDMENVKSISGSHNNYNFNKSILMHKNIPVASVELTKRKGSIIAVTGVFNIKHAPLTTFNEKDGKIDPLKLDDWLEGRSIPASRQNVTKLMRDLNITSPTALALQSYGLSLSDHYWIKPVNQDILWEDINFFQNEFSDDIGKILMDEKNSNDPNIDVRSPDNSSDGMLRKRWTIQNQKRVLIKGADTKYQLQQEPFNEVIASQIMAKLNINRTPYTQLFIDDKPYSLCEAFTNENIEYITAYSVLKHFKRDVKLSEYEQILDNCQKLGIGDMRHKIEQMLVLDYLIANTDRHLGNFGFLRNADTLEYEGFAPIFDSGTSLWCDGSIVSNRTESKPFKKNHNSQIKLVTDLSWYDPIPKNQLTDIIIHNLSKNEPIKDVRVGISEERITKIAETVNQRSEFIANLKKELSSK